MSAPQWPELPKLPDCPPGVLAEIAVYVVARERIAWTQGYRTGYAAGHDVGYGRAEAEIERAWTEVAQHVRGYASAPAYAELESRRWGPGGRGHYGDPRPGDYTGGPVAWVPERGAAA